jgi:hypothetical protein
MSTISLIASSLWSDLYGRYIIDRESPYTANEKARLPTRFACCAAAVPGHRVGSNAKVESRTRRLIMCPSSSDVATGLQGIKSVIGLPTRPTSGSGQSRKMSLGAYRVRFTPISDRIADIPDRQLGANCRSRKPSITFDAPCHFRTHAAQQNDVRGCTVTRSPRRRGRAAGAADPCTSGIAPRPHANVCLTWRYSRPFVSITSSGRANSFDP